MNFFSFKKSNLASGLGLIQSLLLTAYLTLNIINTGNLGVGLPLLVGFVAASSVRLAFKITGSWPKISWHFVVFLFFLGWLAFRILLDIGDINYLKQITIATTGGVLLFFLLGNFSRTAFSAITKTKQDFPLKILVLFFLISSITTFFALKDRLIEENEIFSISDVDGAYQRPGNFIILLFFLLSFGFLSLFANLKPQKISDALLWMTIYTTAMALSLIESQMIGSNAATANILAIFTITILTAALAFNKKVRVAFFNKGPHLSLLRNNLWLFLKILILVMIGFFISSAILIYITEFDLNTTRAFGYGGGTNSSLNSRWEILMNEGISQLEYSPIFGNINVALLASGDAGRTLHSFLLNIFAEMGLVGLLMVLLIFFLVVYKIQKNKLKTDKSQNGYSIFIINTWFLFIFAWLFAYANIAVGKEWPVMWFFIGFSLLIFKFKENTN